ncbi:transglutaminase domain-containing protein [Protaetiibacter sp. SSC-01]|uniref:transglutaminase-like domain-containing protein n=1 Tax=Protaetiibacter sp. SSC-01 TaxID=2759943 RepID=UPI001656DDD6|nr:transglutaminase-like domain-containing protein [Protaetiibacter sp. SSC-01]QNO38600.1 transglutaminase domain-containing protein [Protaetiibacter sp. SSC-01]
MDPEVVRASRHTPFSDPGALRARWEALPADADVAAIGAVVRNLLYHYRADGIEVPEERRSDIDARWVRRILALDAQRHPEPLDVPRERAERVAGCCRDYTLLAVSALRERGVPARSRVGFAGYFGEGFHHDHVVVEFHDGGRWVRADAQLEPAWHPFDTCDLPAAGLAGFATAAEVWRAIRAGEADARSFGVFPGSPFAGEPFVFDYVLRDLAHRMGDELLLWDIWGAMSEQPTDAEAAWMDGLAALTIAADAGDDDAASELARRYERDDRLNPRGRVLQASPYGQPDVEVDLVADAP